ncbi:MAG: DUF1385 domain-containing protein [Deltaproteobacteria bacterium]|nr:DUF1385 domain-containing protein [Deltaproteobacteria bacterium]
MMRSPQSFAIVVRRKSGALVVRERAMPDARKGVLSWPLVRGVASLVEALRLGSQALRFSMDHYEQDMEEEESGKSKPKGGSKPKSDHPGVLNTLASWVLTLATLDTEPQPPTPMPPSKGKSPITWLALFIAIAFFVALPQATAYAANSLLHMNADLRSPGFQLLTGFFKLAIVIGYMLVIRRVPEIYRVFQYHGAEHKTIATWEAEKPLTVENARGHSRLHARCGTAFLVMVVLVSILMFTAIAPLLPHVPVGGAALENVIFFFMKLPALPVVAAITYELQRLSAKYCLTGPLRLVLYPGFAVQLITTVEPDDKQLEVALASLKATLWREQAEEGAAPKVPKDRLIESFDELMALPPYGKAAVAVSSDQHAAP